jgi:hypothetical protein
MACYFVNHRDNFTFAFTPSLHSRTTSASAFLTLGRVNRIIPLNTFETYMGFIFYIVSCLRYEFINVSHPVSLHSENYLKLVPVDALNFTECFV